MIDVRENDGVCDDNCGLWIEMKAVGKVKERRSGSGNRHYVAGGSIRITTNHQLQCINHMHQSPRITNQFTDDHLDDEAKSEVKFICHAITPNHTALIVRMMRMVVM